MPIPAGCRSAAWVNLRIGATPSPHWVTKKAQATSPRHHRSAKQPRTRLHPTADLIQWSAAAGIAHGALSRQSLRMDLPILYSFRRCPYAMRARMALAVSGAVCHIREVKLAHKPAELVASSPKATVPVLVLPDGQVIAESLDIMIWALTLNDPEGWLERDDRFLIDANDASFKHHLDRYKYPNRHASDPLSHRANGLEILAKLDERLGIHENLCGPKRGLTDIAIFPFVRQFAEVDRAWFDEQPLPKLQAWLSRHLASRLFETSMLKLVPWEPAHPPVQFPASLEFLA